MPYAAYKLIHFLGIFTMIGALVAAGIHVLRGGTRADDPYRRVLGVAHGVAAFLILLGGFGMLARMGVMHEGLPAWAKVKLVIWVALGASMALPYRGRGLARGMLIALPALLLAAAAAALYKPF
jgi:hypothetical protein